MSSRFAHHLFGSLRNTISTRYSGYRASNYITKTNPQSQIRDYPNVCKEIDKIIENPPFIASSILQDSQNIQDSQDEHTIISPLFGHPVVGRYSYCNDTDLQYTLTHYHIENRNRKTKQFDIDARIDCFLKIADLIETTYWDQIIATSIVGQGKTIYEAEIDCVGELVDFLRFNVQFATEIVNKQPISTMNEKNMTQYLPMRGFMTAITPFNFTAIAANLSLTPLLFGNTVFWKPCDKALLSNRLFYDICIESGIPPDVLKFIVMEPESFGNKITQDPNMSGLLFTGSSTTFTTLYKNIIHSIDQYYNYPRIVGETGGKNFHFVDVTADIKLVAQKTFEAAFGYSGQKCSACSRLYLPVEMYDDFMNEISICIRKQLIKRNYTVIDKKNYDMIKQVIESIKENEQTKIVMGGETDEEDTYYIEPTIFISDTSDTTFMMEELFGPILGVRLYTNVYDSIDECINCTPYALTGAIFSQDKIFIEKMNRMFENSCGNFYINDGCTKAVVGRQPFGGSGLSGTNDKAGDVNFLYKLFNQRNIKISNEMM